MFSRRETVGCEQSAGPETGEFSKTGGNGEGLTGASN
jgi:hypothetical protein